MHGVSENCTSSFDGACMLCFRANFQGDPFSLEELAGAFGINSLLPIYDQCFERAKDLEPANADSFLQ